MSDEEWVALIGGLSLVIGGILSAIGLLIKSTLDSGHLKEQVEQIRHQVKNSHEKNLRDEIDDIKDSLSRLVTSVAANTDRLSNLDAQVGEIRRSAFDAVVGKIRHPFGGGTDKET